MLNVDGLKSRKSGVSLAETLVSLVIFSSVIFPLILIPIKAVKGAQDVKNSSLQMFEIKSIFEDMRHEIAHAYSFYPLTVHQQPNLDYSQQLFIAYWNEAGHDPSSQSERRVGFEFRQIPSRKMSGQTQWQLMTTGPIQEGKQINQYQIGSQSWFTATKVLNGTNLYFTGANNGNPQFVYCLGSTCSTNVTPDVADGVSIQSVYNGQTTGGINLVYQNTSVPVPPLYFKLASAQTNPNRNSVKNQLMAFSTAVDPLVSATQESWLSEYPLSVNVGGQSQTFYVPVTSSKELGNGSMGLPVNDFYYNYMTQDLLVASSSTAATPSQKGLYIFKIKPGFPSYSPYLMQMQSGQTSYANYFPIILHAGDPGWPGDPGGVANPDFISVTQDHQQNIYALARVLGLSSGTEYMVEKFSPQGQFLSRFALEPAIGQAIGIAFNPVMDHEVQVLVQKGDLSYHIQSYLKDQSQEDPNRVIKSAESVNLANIFGPSFLSYGINGFDFDPLHQRYLIINGGFSVAAMDIHLLQTPPIMASNITLSTIPTAGTSTPYQPTGVAYNPLNNMLYISAISGSNANSYYFRVLPDVLLNKTYRQ